MSPTTPGNWKGRAWAKRWMERRSELESRQETGEWINCDANCYCCRYMVDEGCIDTEDDANENCPAPGPTPSAAPAPTAGSSTTPPASETMAATTEVGISASTTGESGTASTLTPSSTTTNAPGTTAPSSSVAQEWVFPVATGSIRARQAGVVDAAAFGPVYREDAMIVQWAPEDTTPGIQWFCESNSGSRSGGLVSSNQSQPLRIQFNSLADQTGTSDDVYCRLGFTDAPGQTVQWQYINTPNANGANVISAPANLATAAVATATSLINSATTTISTSPTSTSETGSGGGGLSTGAAAGVGVGVGVVVIIAIVLGVFFWRRKKNKGSHRTPLWVAGSKEPSNSDGSSSQPAYYSDDRKVENGVYELPGADMNPTELPAGIKGTAAMPSELYDHHDRKDIGLAELGSDKDLEEQQFRPRPLAPQPILRLEGEDDGVSSPSDYGGTENGTVRSAVSPASGTLNSETSGMVSQHSPVSAASQDGEPGWAAERSRFQRKPVGKQ